MSERIKEIFDIASRLKVDLFKLAALDQRNLDCLRGIDMYSFTVRYDLMS